MRRIFKALADKVSDAVENVMDRFNPEKVHLDCRRDDGGTGRLFAVGTIPSNKWDIYWVQNGGDTFTLGDRIKTALSTTAMMQQMEEAKRRPVNGEKAPGHYDNWLQRNVRRLAKQGITPAPALAA